MLERIRAAQDLRPTHKTGSHRPDSKANKRDGHHRGRLVDVVLDFVRDARGPRERHKKKAEHIKRGQPRGDQRNGPEDLVTDRKSTRLNSSHLVISYAVFCLKKKTSMKYQRKHR